MKTLLLSTLLTIIIFAFQPVSSQAQINLKRITNNAINSRANKKANEAVNKGLDEVEGIFKKKDDPKNEAEKTANDKENTDQAKGSQTAGTQNQPSLQSFSKYDFVPGDKGPSL